MTVKILSEIKRVMSVQMDSVNFAKTAVGASYENAVRSLFRCRGKVVVTGIGKSGLIAQKFASTLASTGTPAIYLHPVEGMHGNLGIVSKNDIVFCIGKSGESEEILNILPAVRKIGASIISLTANKDSSLARESSLVLHMPVKREACPLNLAPTTSSTVALVICDAIAIVLMKMRGFGPESFALFHPGGLLGKRLLLKVSDVMRSGKLNPVVHINESMEHLLVEITQKWTGAASIVDSKRRLLGIVTDYDIRKAFAEEKIISNLKIKDVMNSRPMTIYSDEMAIKALQIMESRKKPLTILPVIDRHKRSVGMIHLHDLISKGLVQPASSIS